MADSDIDSFLSTDSLKKAARAAGGSKRRREETTLGSVIEHQRQRLLELSTQREAVRNDMLSQCKINEKQFEALLDKKKRAKLIEQQLLGMNQEFNLMQKQVQRKEKIAKDLQTQVQRARFYNDLRRQRKTIQQKFREEQKTSNQDQVKRGHFLRDVSVKNKQQLIESLKEQKRRMYLECKEKAKADEAKKRTDVGSTVNQRVIQAKENKINEELGNLIKRQHTKKKIDELSSQITFRIRKCDSGILNLKGNVKDLLKSQESMKKKLEKANKEFEHDYHEAIRMNLVSDLSRSRLGKSTTFNYNFSGFQEKANRAQFLFFEEERKKKDFKDELSTVKKQVEIGLRLHHSMSGVHSKNGSAGKELQLKFS